MARRIKVTGFTRFFLFLIIIAPTIFFGVSYYKGVDGIQMLKDMINGDFSGVNTEVTKTEPANAPVETEVVPPVEKPSTSQINGEVAKLQDELDYKNEKIEELYQENASLKEEKKKVEEELETVKKQLEAIKKAMGGAE